jgi:hypothetical protein
MTGLAAWHITGSGPLKLNAGRVSLEKDLEDWIASDPALVEPGLRVIGQQLQVDGGKLDLLCVDTQGRATVVEIKRGNLIRDVVAQAIDYASSIATMPTATLTSHVVAFAGEDALAEPQVASLLEEEDADRREVAMVIVGTGSDQGLDRVLDFLTTGFSFPVRAVTFNVFTLGSGEQILVREEREQEQQEANAVSQRWTREDVIARAGGPDSPNGRHMSLLADAAERAGLYVKPYKWTLMFAPPTNKNRYLMTVWRVSKTEPLQVRYSIDALAEFFPNISPSLAREILGPDDKDDDYLPVATDDDALELGERIVTLFTTSAEDANNA